MTVETTISRVQYATDGSSTVFGVPFPFLEPEHLAVIYTDAAGAEALLVLSVDYTAAGAGNSSGVITTTIAYPGGGTLTIKRAVPPTQETDYVETDAFPAESHERALDKLTMLAQQAQSELGSALRVPEEATQLPRFPAASARANKLAAFDAFGNPAAVAPSAQSASALAIALANPASATEGAAMVAFNDALPYASGTVGAALKASQGGAAVTLYVAPAGSDANDGSISAPFATLQKAFDVLMAAGIVRSATINLAAGTYDTVANRTALLGPANEDEAGDPNIDPYTVNGVLAVNSIRIQGPDVGYDPTTNPWPTPTAIFDAGGAAVVGIRIEGRGLKVLIKNIKFKNYNGSGNSAGITNDAGFLRTENVHAEACSYGIDSHKGLLEVAGGDIYGTPAKVGTGIRSLFRAFHQIGDQSAVGQMRGPRLRYLTTGFLAQEGSTGHSDSVLYEDCLAGITATVNARVNYSYSNFKRCDRAIRAENNAVIFGYPTAEFNYFPSPDSNVESIIVQSGAVDMDRDPNANNCRATDYLNAPVTVTGSTGNIDLLTKTLTLGRFAPTVNSIRKPQHIEGKAFGTINATTAGNVQFKFRIGVTTSAGITLPAGQVAADFVIDFSIVFTAYNRQYLSMRMSVHNRAALADVAAETLNLATTEWSLVFQCQLANAADSVTFSHVHFKTVG